jgi:putative AdoMet-dependent methyltransferase
MIPAGSPGDPQPDPFPPGEFDAWAETYDQDAQDDGFPFTGYAAVLDAVVELCGAQTGESVLDLGAGTGNLAALFNRIGCELWLTDFSKPMLDQARSRLPGARFFLADLRGPWPVELDQRFHHIVSAYVFHHFELPEKVRLARRLFEEHLMPGGMLVIADISFPDQAALAAVRAASGNRWDEEPYWIAGEALPVIQQAGLPAAYRQISSCAGIYWMHKADV